MKIIKKTDNSSKIKDAIKQVDKSAMRVGWGEDQRYQDGEPVAMIAAQNEFGNRSKNIPARPFMRLAIIGQGDKWKAMLGQGISKVLDLKETVSSVFEKLGGIVAGDIKKAIVNVTAPALKASTVAARLRGKKQGKAVSLTVAKPLVDTKVMLNSIIHEEVQK